MDSEYCWIIDKDVIEDGKLVGLTGPSNCGLDMLDLLKDPDQGEAFRMLDGDDELYYEGRIIGDYLGFEPMDDFGGPGAGCTDIQYRIANGRWVGI